MKKAALVLQISAVFIGTIVGAGLASGQEIIQFFTIYGFKGILGIVICGMLYIATGVVTVKMSYKYKAASYRDLIYIACGKYLGWVIDAFTTLFLFGGICIILAGSGSIFSEYLNLPYIVGVMVMAIATAAVVLYSTDGLMFINSIIVPCMVTIIVMLFITTMMKTPINEVKNSIVYAREIKKGWFLSTLLYMSFNMLMASGVFAPMTMDINESKHMSNGIILGSLGLFILTIMIDIVLLINAPGIFRYSIPMLSVAKKAGPLLGTMLSIAIWCEMFSTAVSDVYSLAKKMKNNFDINYSLSVLLLLAAAYPFTGFGFANLIKLLYPPFGIISLIYLICLTGKCLKS